MKWRPRRQCPLIELDLSKHAAILFFRLIGYFGEGLAKFTYKHFVTASSRSRLGKATESTTLTEPQPLGRGNGTKAAG
jgi:hypothetical protein